MWVFIWIGAQGIVFVCRPESLSIPLCMFLQEEVCSWSPLYLFLAILEKACAWESLRNREADEEEIKMAVSKVMQQFQMNSGGHID